MEIRVPLFFPHKYQSALRAWRKHFNLPLLALEKTALYLWSSTLIFVASHDGYLRILFDSSSCFVEVYMGPAALWCLSFSVGRLYVSFWDGVVRAFDLGDALVPNWEAMHHCATPGEDTVLCLSAALDVLCGTSAAGYCYIFSRDLAWVIIVPTFILVFVSTMLRS